MFLILVVEAQQRLRILSVPPEKYVIGISGKASSLPVADVENIAVRPSLLPSPVVFMQVWVFDLFHICHHGKLIFDFLFQSRVYYFRLYVLSNSIDVHVTLLVL